MLEKSCGKWKKSLRAHLRLVWSMGMPCVTVGCSSQFYIALGTGEEGSRSSRSRGGGSGTEARGLERPLSNQNFGSEGPFPDPDWGEPAPRGAPCSSGYLWKPLARRSGAQNCTAIFVCRDKLPVHLSRMSLWITFPIVTTESQRPGHSLTRTLSGPNMFIILWDAGWVWESPLRLKVDRS